MDNRGKDWRATRLQEEKHQQGQSIVIEEGATTIRVPCENGKKEVYITKESIPLTESHSMPHPMKLMEMDFLMLQFRSLRN